MLRPRLLAVMEIVNISLEYFKFLLTSIKAMDMMKHHQLILKDQYTKVY